MTRRIIVADPQGTTYIEPIMPQPPAGFEPYGCPHHIGEIVQVVTICQWERDCKNAAVAVREFFGSTINVCQRCLDSLSRDVPKVDIEQPILRRITAARCEDLEGVRCWIMELERVT